MLPPPSLPLSLSPSGAFGLEFELGLVKQLFTLLRCLAVFHRPAKLPSLSDGGRLTPSSHFPLQFSNRDKISFRRGVYADLLGSSFTMDFALVPGPKSLGTRSTTLQWLSVKMPLNLHVFGSERLVRIERKMLNCVLAWQSQGFINSFQCKTGFKNPWYSIVVYYLFKSLPNRCSTRIVLILLTLPFPS